MAINNVRFESRSQTIAPPELIWQYADYEVDVAQVLAATDPYVAITPEDDATCLNLMNFSVQAMASNSIPLLLRVETVMQGQANSSLIPVELSPGGSFDYEHMTLSMLPLFKSEADFVAATINIVSVFVTKASVSSYGATSGILKFSVAGARAVYA